MGGEKKKGRKEGRREDGEVTAAGRAVDTAAKTGSRERRNEGRAAKHLREGKGSAERQRRKGSSGEKAAAAAAAVAAAAAAAAAAVAGVFNTNNRKVLPS